MKRGTFNNVIVISGAIAIGCASTAILDKVDKMEDSKMKKNLYKVGTWCGVVAAGGLIGSVLMAGDTGYFMYQVSNHILNKKEVEEIVEKEEEA